MDRYNPAHLTYRFDPDYPAAAKQQHLEGIVKLHLTVDPDGGVSSVNVLDGPELLIPAAVAAVKNWRYLPALLNGEPVASEKDIEVEFRLPPSE